MRQVFPITRGSRPLNLRVNTRGQLLFGEYGGGLEQARVRLYASDDGGRSFHPIWEFVRGEVRHVHNVLPDPDGSHWVLTGDYEAQPGIANLASDFRSLEWLVRGNQRARAVSAVVTERALIYGTDSDHQPNYIARLDRATCSVDLLQDIEGSSLFATRCGTTGLISTCVEPNPACPSTEAVLYGSRDMESWHRIAAYPKDIWHPVLFQFGAVVLATHLSQIETTIYSGQAVSRAHDRVFTVTVS